MDLVRIPLLDGQRALGPETGAEGPIVPARAGASPRTLPAGAGEEDPLDEFFWRADEVAPTLPDLIATSELPGPAEAPEERRQWLTFRLREEVYALEIHHVREILKAPPLTEVPRAPAHVLGVIMNRGEVITVVDPRAHLALPRREPDPRCRILVCDGADGSRGLLVDAVSHVAWLGASDVEGRPASMRGPGAECIQGIGHDHGRLYVLLDAAALLADPAGPDGEEARA